MSAPAPSLPPSPAPPLCVQFLSLSSWGPKVPVGGEGGEAQSAGRLGPSPKCSSPASQHAPLPARAELAGVSEGGGRGGGLMGERRVVGWWRRTGGVVRYRWMAVQWAAVCGSSDLRTSPCSQHTSAERRPPARWPPPDQTVLEEGCRRCPWVTAQRWRARRLCCQSKAPGRWVLGRT